MSKSKPFDKASHALNELSAAVAELENENHRLQRLLVTDYKCARHSDHATCEDCIGMCGGCTLRAAMHEAGIEVNK